MRSAKGVQLVVCDMAGTTVRDEHEVESCFTRAAMETSLEMTDEEILAVQGWSKRHVFEVFWERQVGSKNSDWKNKVDHSYAAFREILEQHYLNSPVLPTRGCLDFLAFMKEKKIPVALTTGFYRKVTNIILDKMGWLQDLDDNYTGNAQSLISASIASDEVGQGRPQPDMIFRAMQLTGVTNKENVLNIGDTPSDIQSGKNAGCRFSCCLTNGTHSGVQLEPEHPDLAFESMSDFTSWLKTSP